LIRALFLAEFLKLMDSNMVLVCPAFAYSSVMITIVNVLIIYLFIYYYLNGK